MTRPPTPAEDPCERVLREALRTHLTPELLEGFGRAAIARVQAAMTNKNGAPGWTPGTPPPPTADKEPKAMNDRTHKHGMTLCVGDVITRHPQTGLPGEWTVISPPVRYRDFAEIQWSVGDKTGTFAVRRSDRVVIRPPARADAIEELHRTAEDLAERPEDPATIAAREQRLHDMTGAEEHYALRWLAEHVPAAFDRAADYVDRIRRLDASNVRKESRS